MLPEILERLPTTLFLTGGAVILWLSIGIPIGMLSAVKTGSWMDRLAMGIALIFISAPVYFLGLVALYLFDDNIGKFPILPGNSAYGAATAFLGQGGGADHAVVRARGRVRGGVRALPAGQPDRDLAGGLHPHRPGQGPVSERRVIFRHGVRAAITPIVTLLGLDIGILLGGAILTETVFNIPGIGRYAFNAINVSDLPVIQGTVLFGAFFIVMMSLIVDILYAFIDPRVRY